MGVFVRKRRRTSWDSLNIKISTMLQTILTRSLHDLRIRANLSNIIILRGCMKFERRREKGEINTESEIKIRGNRRVPAINPILRHWGRSWTNSSFPGIPWSTSSKHENRKPYFLGIEVTSNPCCSDISSVMDASNHWMGYVSKSRDPCFILPKSIRNLVIFQSPIFFRHIKQWYRPLGHTEIIFRAARFKPYMDSHPWN